MSSLCSRALTPLCCILLFTIATGCGCKGEMRHFDDITVSLAPTLKTNDVYPSVEVDVIAVPDNDTRDWTKESVDNFFAPGFDRRVDPTLLRTLLLGQEQTSQTLEYKKMEALWDKWKERKVMKLIFVSNYPRLAANKSGNDERILEVPLSCERWEETKKLSISVIPAGLDLETKPLREQK